MTSPRSLPLAALILSGGLARAQVMILPRVSTLVAGKTRTFRVVQPPVAALPPEGCPEGGPQPFHYSADFIEPDGSLAERLQGTGLSGAPVSLQGTFTQPGTGLVVVRCVTEGGVSSDARREVQVR